MNSALSAENPFMVVEGLAETGALMPTDLRAFMTHELGMSPHAVMREAVPLLLLDPELAVRQAAAAVLDQIAGPETFSSVMLRRTLLIRNWVPEAEREAIDRLARKARVKGVACAQWAPTPALAIHGSLVDGSGAQSLLLTTPAGRTRSVRRAVAQARFWHPRFLVRRIAATAQDQPHVEGGAADDDVACDWTRAP